MAERIDRKMRGAADQLQAVACAAVADKGLCHFPFRGRVEEAELFTRLNVFEANQLHRLNIKEHVRVAAVVHVLQKIRLQGDVFIIACLYGEVARVALYGTRRKSADGFARMKSFGRVQGVLA